ncbi:MAG: glycoside hydrolase family 17 [SAR324 cluster bacterium]
MHRWRSLPGCAVAAAVSAGLWLALGRPVALPDAPEGRIPCVSYVPASPAGSPLDSDPDMGFPVPAGLIRRDLAALARYTNCVRTYSVLGPQGAVVAAAEAAGMQVLLGVWIGADERENEREIARGIALAKAHRRTVRALVVGNEVLLRREMSGARLAALLRRVKKLTPVPVAYADIFHFWQHNPEVADAVDLMLVHILPYWDDPSAPPAERVGLRVREIVGTTRATFPGKDIEIGEVGWPSAGRTRAEAVPSRVNEARVVREIASLAAGLRIEFNLIEGIDQSWKRVPEGTAGGHWGLLDTERRPKFPLSGPVSEWPHWPLAAAFTFLLAGAALAWAAATGREISPPRWLALGLAAPAAAAILWALGNQALDMTVGPLGWVWTGFLLVLAAAGACLLLRKAIGGPSPWLAQPAPLSSLLQGLPVSRGAWPGYWLAVLAWSSRFTATVVALLLAVDGRHRDFLTLAYVLPGAALALPAAQSPSGAPHGPQPEAGWVAGALAVLGFCAVDHPADREAWAWALCCVLLAAPWLGHTWREAAHIVRRFWPGHEQ